MGKKASSSLARPKTTSLLDLCPICLSRMGEREGYFECLGCTFERSRDAFYFCKNGLICYMSRRMSSFKTIIYKNKTDRIIAILWRSEEAFSEDRIPELMSIMDRVTKLKAFL